MFLYGVRYASLFGAQALRLRMSDGSQPATSLVEAAAKSLAKIERTVEAPPELHALFLELSQGPDRSERKIP